MKKIKKIACYILLIICCFSLIGCSTGGNTKTLSCSKEISNSNGLVTSMVTEITYEGDNINKINLITKLVYEENKYTEDEITSLVSNIVDGYESNYSNSDNIKISSNKISDTEYDVTLQVLYSKLSDEEKSTYNLSFNETYDEAKSNFEVDSYTCK